MPDVRQSEELLRSRHLAGADGVAKRLEVVLWMVGGIRCGHGSEA